MDQREELEALRRLAELEAKAGNMGVGRATMGQGGTMFDSMKGGIEPAMIGLGRTADKAQAGMQQANTALEVIKAEAMGRDSSQATRGLGMLEQQQAEKDRLYAPLQKEHPMATALGENLPLAATPMGQATTMGRVMAPALAGATMQGVQYGSPAERAKSVVKGGAEGFVGGVAGEGIRRVIQPIPGALGGAAQEEARKAAAAIPGARLLPSQTTGSPGLRALEDMLAQSPGGRGPVAKQIQGTSKAVTRHYLKGVGVEADIASPDVLAQAHAQIRADYARISPGVKLDVTQNVLDAVDNAEKALLKGANAGKEQAIAEVRRLKDQLYATKSMPGEDWGAWQSDIGSIARGTENDKVASILRNLREELNNHARGPAAAEWKKIDRRNAMFETLMRPNVINAEGQISPVAVNRILNSDFGKTYRTGSLKSEAADVGRFGATVRNPREGSQTFGRGEMDSAIGLMKSLIKYPAAKAMTSPSFADYLSKGLLASPEASGIGAGILGPATVPLVVGPADLGLRKLLFQ